MQQETRPRNPAAEASTAEARRPAERRDLDRGALGRRYGVGWIVALLVAVAVLAGFVIYLALDDNTSAGPEIGVTTLDLVNDPADFFGSTVVISDNVEAVLTSSAVTLETENLLVVGDALPSEIERGDLIQVTGQIRPVGELDLEAVAGIDLENDEQAQTLGIDPEGEFVAAVDFESPAIVAERVSLTPKAGANDAEAPEPAG